MQFAPTPGHMLEMTDSEWDAYERTAPEVRDAMVAAVRQLLDNCPTATATPGLVPDGHGDHVRTLDTVLVSFSGRPGIACTAHGVQSLVTAYLNY